MDKPFGWGQPRRRLLRRPPLTLRAPRIRPRRRHLHQAIVVPSSARFECNPLDKRGRLRTLHITCWNWSQWGKKLFPAKVPMTTTLTTMTGKMLVCASTSWAEREVPTNVSGDTPLWNRLRKRLSWHFVHKLRSGSRPANTHNLLTTILPPNADPPISN